VNFYSGLVIGGLLPALFFGIGAIFQKYSNDIGIGQSNYLASFSLGIVITALIALFIFKENSFSYRAGLFAVGHGFFFGLGFVCLAIGLTTYSIPVAKLVPLANMSTLVAVVLGLIIFSEYSKLNIVYLLSGSGLIILGGVLVSKA